MNIKTPKIKECPYCGSRKITTGIQSGYGQIAAGTFGRSSALIHDICTHCGAVVLSRVDNKELFIKKYEKEKMKED